MLSISKKMKIFCGVCILISMVLIFETWIKCAVDLSTYQDEIIGGLRWLQMWTDNDKAVAIGKIIETMLDGKLSAVEILMICKNGIVLADLPLDNEVLVFFYIYIIDFIVVIISGLWTEYKIYKGYISNGDKIFFVSQLILTILTVIIAHSFSNVFDTGINLMSITRIPFITIIFALPMVIKYKIPIDKNIDNVEEHNRFKKINWEDKNTYCLVCGNKIENNDKVCSKCGTPIKENLDEK